MLALVLAIGAGVAAAPAWACDCQKRQEQKQCNCGAQSCPGECAGMGDPNKEQKPAKTKPDKSRRGGTTS
jgi:hypothetical protein